MAGLAGYLYNTMSSAIFGSAPDPRDEEPQGSRVPLYSSDRYSPSVGDVISIKQMLRKEKEIPMELVDVIIDYAEYWPHTSCTRTGGTLLISNAMNNEENQFLLRSFPLGYMPNATDPTTCPMDPPNASQYLTLKPQAWPVPDNLPQTSTENLKKTWIEQSEAKVEFPCRKIVFTVKSRDQGWGGDPGHRGSYKGSFTWFEVGKETVAALSDMANIEHPSLDQLSKLVTLPKQDEVNSGITQDEKLTGIQETPLTCTTRTLLPATQPKSNPSDGTEFYHPLLPEEGVLIQRNVTAIGTAKTHTITWSCYDNVDPDSLEGKEIGEKGRGRETASGEFVRNLKVGDVITVWGKARFPGWTNKVDEVKIDVYWYV